jgi:hypothetical protein
MPSPSSEELVLVPSGFCHLLLTLPFVEAEVRLPGETLLYTALCQGISGGRERAMFAQVTLIVCYVTAQGQ